MRLTNPVAWFRDEMRRERLESRDRAERRRVKMLEHPARSAATTAIVWGGVWWLLVVRSTDLRSLVALVIFATGFGVVSVWLARRRQRKLTFDGRSEVGQRP